MLSGAFSCLPPLFVKECHVCSHVADLGHRTQRGVSDHRCFGVGEWIDLARNCQAQ
jgi:hypothetical protein